MLLHSILKLRRFLFKFSYQQDLAEIIRLLAFDLLYLDHALHSKVENNLGEIQAEPCHPEPYQNEGSPRRPSFFLFQDP